jgi:hypothetical protein
MAVISWSLKGIRSFVVSLARPFVFLTGLAGLTGIQLLLTQYSKKDLMISRYLEALFDATAHEVRNSRTSMVVHCSMRR